MKKHIFIILLFVSFSLFPNVEECSLLEEKGYFYNSEGERYEFYEGSWYAVRYVTVAGGGSGTSTGSPWTFSTAISSAVAGDIVYVQAGNYGVLNLVQNNDGSAGNLIRFVGTNSSWTPIATTTGSTYTRTDALNATDMPYLNTGLAAGGLSTYGTAIDINGDYVEFQNFNIRGYAKGMEVDGNNNLIINVNTDFMGDFRFDNKTPGHSNYLGRSIDVDGNYNEIRNSFHRDADAQCVTITGDYNEFYNIEVYTSRYSGNTVDYQFLFSAGAQYNVAYNINIIREEQTIHLGHGIVFKPNGADASYNLVDGFYCENSKIEIQFGRTHHNTVRNGTIINTTGRSGSVSDADYAATGIHIANGAYDNLVENVFLFEPTWTVNNEDWGDGASSSASDDAANAGENNTLNNIVSINPRSGHIALQGATNEHGTENSIAKNFRMFNSTLIGGAGLFYYNGATGSLTGGIYNTILHSVPGFSSGSGGSINASFVFNYVNNSSSFATSSYSSYTDSNLSTADFTATNTKANLADTTWDYTPVNDNMEIGFDFSGTLTEAGFDFFGNERTAIFTIGAIEKYHGGGGDPDPTCSDGIQNGDETGVDCGGSDPFCPPCSSPGGVARRKLLRAFYDN